MAIGSDPTELPVATQFARIRVESAGAPSPHLSSMQFRELVIHDQFEDVRFITTRRTTVYLSQVGSFAVGQPSKFAALPPSDIQDIL
jgi:hypothetical protein